LSLNNTDRVRHAGYLRDIFGALNFTFVGYEHAHQAQTAPNPIRVHTIYATFEVAHWPAKEVERQERLTMERISKLCQPDQAKSNNRGFGELYDDGLPIAIVSTGEVQTSNAKRRRMTGKGPTSIVRNLNETLQLSEQTAQAAQGRPPLSAQILHVIPGAVKELGSGSRKERIAAVIAQARAALSYAAQKIGLEPELDGSAVAQIRRLNPSRFAQRKRKTSPSGGDRSSLGKEKDFATTEESDQAFARELLVRHSNSKLSVIDRAAALRANRDKSFLPVNDARLTSKAGNNLPHPIQRIQGSREHTARSLDLFLETVTEAWSGVSFETQKHDINLELQAQREYIGEILFTHEDSCSLSEDAQAMVLDRIITQLLVGFEEAWADSHPEVTVPAVENVLDRQTAYLTLDVAIKCGDVAELDETELLVHITAVQKEAMSRQLTILKAITESLRQKVQCKRAVLAPSQDEKATFGSPIAVPSQQVSSGSDGSSKPIVQNPLLVIDQVTGVASVVQAADSEKTIDGRSTRGLQKSLKRKQALETLPSRKKAKTIDAQEGNAVAALREQSMPLPCLAQSTAANGGFHTTSSIAKHLFSEAEAEAEWGMTVTPVDLVLSSTTSSSEPTSNTPPPNRRGFMDVVEAFKVPGYNILSDEDRTESLRRHRLANRALLGERSPLRDGGIGSVGVDDFFYVTSEDAAPGLGLDSIGLRKW
jgi:hypothetical protein